MTIKKFNGYLCFLHKELLFYTVLSFLFSCEQTIDLQIENFEERPIIQANFEIFKDYNFSRNFILLRKTTAYYEENYDAIETGIVTVKNTLNDSVYNFDHRNSGIYTNENFVLKENTEYELKVTLENEVYLSYAESVANSTINKIEYIKDRIVENEKFKELKVYFSDDVQIENYYVFLVNNNNPRLINDEFFNGEEFNFSVFIRESEIFDNRVVVQSHGIDKNYYTYLSKIIELNEPQFYGPFSTSPPNPNGNIINTTNLNNYAFGYFQISVVHEKEYNF